jgi:hypothetical protein
VRKHNSKMELQLTSAQKTKLLELYQSFHLNYDNLEIQMSPTKISIQANERSTQLIIPARYQRIQKLTSDKYINDALNTSIDYDEELYSGNDLSFFINIAVDQTKTHGQRLYAYSKSWKLLQTDLDEQNTTLKQKQREIQQITGQNGFRFTTIAQRANRLLTLLGGIFVHQFKYVTPNYLFHLSNNSFEYFISQINEQMERAFNNFAGAQS